MTPSPEPAFASATTATEPGGNVARSAVQPREDTGPEIYLPGSVAQLLFDEPYLFDFFQSVRLLERLQPERKPIGYANHPKDEIVRFRSLASLTFPPSPNYDLQKATDRLPPALTVAFFGMVGPNGALPRHYTEIVMKQEREVRGEERYALRDWLDLFNHRLISLFYRAWTKYRFPIAYERGLPHKKEPDAFTRTLFSLAGLGEPSLRNRLRVGVKQDRREEPERILAQVDDLGLLHFAGMLSKPRRDASSLERLLQDYFDMPIEIRQFQGQWLPIEPENQSRIGGPGQLGINVVAGNRVWDTQSKFRVRVGPLGYHGFTSLLPDRAPVPERKAVFVLIHLVRFVVGPELDFDVQVLLRKEDVPACELVERPSYSPRLGWNTWLTSQQPARDAEDAVFAGVSVRWLGA